MLIGHKKQWKFLKKIAESDYMPHALLFSGSSSIGKKKIAFDLAKIMFCQEECFLKRPCQKCRACLDIENNSHPDLAFISNDSSEIQIFQIKELIWKLSLKPYSAPSKIAIIDNAHLMNQESQNCLLKTLEEPKGKMLIFLITSYPEALLPTIVSRTQNIKFFPVAKSEVNEYLKDKSFSLKETDYILSSSLGKPGKAINFLKNIKTINDHKKAESDLEALIKGDFAFRFNFVKKITSGLKEEKSSNIMETLGIWINYFRKALINQTQTNNNQGYSIKKLKRIISEMQTVYYLLSTTNINKKLALEILMIEL